ncbi:MAG TPA: aminomethyl-transferring glycine dehydrogenase [Tepidisphaeraceae bacterium]|jgi:glycine dehydrogenase|nr:aminomethyl-transferring glycine dehydrogenase [Tepidisphaeraceae bacterium]
MHATSDVTRLSPARPNRTTDAAVPHFGPTDTFVHRHIGPDDAEVATMLETLGVASLEELTAKTVPAAIRLQRPLNLGPERGEAELLEDLKKMASENKVFTSCIGAGYSDCITPPVIQRNILENPGWYTQYTPYQPEISQGRMEALINFQTMVAELTGLPLANASLLDEGTAAAEAMFMFKASATDAARNVFFVANDCHPQTIAVVQTRARSLGIDVVVASTAVLADSYRDEQSALRNLFGVLLQYPTTNGDIVDYRELIAKVHGAGALVVMAADILALTLITPPGEMGADVAIGSTQRFGVPLGFGGPHAAYMATKPDYVRKMPGRLIGVSKDVAGNPAYRLTLQTREQHIRREKATSNICTAQVLLAVMASMYAVYHGPEGLKAIARRVNDLTRACAAGIRRMGHEIVNADFFDTIRVRPADLPASSILAAAQLRGINLRDYGDGTVGISLDETTSTNEVEVIIESFAGGSTARLNLEELAAEDHANRKSQIGNRKSEFLQHPIFNRYHSETELLRYIFKLQSRDLSLAQSMIPLGSCTMKLNATSEMLPVTWPEFGRIHPFAPAEQTRGYAKLFAQLEKWLSEITGFAAVSLQPNAGSQGEYAGLMTIRAYHESRGDMGRNICLIPTSAHGTNPASAAIAGFSVVAVKCDADGNVDVPDLKAKAAQHADKLAALMITYPSTHGVFEEAVTEICQIVHDHGGQVYMDGANMNAQVGLCRPGDIGADVCHLNLHKTFCIPHGGGGPGMGPIGVAAHLAPFLPGHPVVKPENAGREAIGPVSAAPYGSSSILPISWVYIALMGSEGLKRATQVAILNANYMAKRLEDQYDVLFRGKNGFCAHEFIIDCRGFEASSGIKVDDIAKRLMDYGFHAPTMSFPVAGTLMIEPTESESKHELDRFCDAMIAIRAEIAAIESGSADRADNVLKHAPHTTAAVTADEWPHQYTRQQAAYPAAWLRDFKFWPSVARVDNPYGDRNLFCTCLPMSDA